MKFAPLVIGGLILPLLCSARTLTVDPGSTPRGDRFASIAAALKALQPGDTLKISDGVYRESIDLRATSLPRDGAAGAVPTRIEAAKGAAPLIKGSDVVTGWENVSDHLYVKRDWTTNSQQLFVDGVEYRQVGGVLFDGFPNNPKHKFATLHQSQGGIWPGRIAGGVEELKDKSFHYDTNERALYVKSSDDIRKRTVEASVRSYLVFGERHNDIEIRGLRFTHANTTSVSQSGALTLIGDRIALDAVRVERVDGSGIDLSGNDNRVSRSVANYCGIVGMKVRGRNAKLQGNETNYNNARGFNKWWEAGGAKFVGDGGLRDSEIDGHRAIGNRGDGLWFDWHNDNNDVHGVVSAYNEGMGIHYEASARARIHDNYVFGNRQRGIYLANSSHSVVANNLVAANELDGIALVDDRHAKERGPPDLVPIGNRVRANVIGWNKKAALIIPDAPDNASDGNLFVGTAPTFSRGWPTRESPLRNGLKAWQQASGFDARSTAQELALPEGVQSELAKRDDGKASRELWRFLLEPLHDLKTNDAKAGPQP